MQICSIIAALCATSRIRAGYAHARRQLVCREKAERERRALLARQQAQEAERLAEETRRSQVLNCHTVLD